jgi:hypothetical protein|tara:strand:- start:560 stop:1261 length:702 start_codon:yes stop_codon:yes gene_type:complete
MPNIEQLYDLQILDSQISDLDKSLSDIKHKLSDESAISSAKSEVDKIKTYQDNFTLKYRSIENMLDDLQERLKQLDSKLYSGNITSERELSAGQDERNFIVEDIKKKEDELLEYMVMLDTIESRHNQAQQTLSRLEKQRPAEKKLLLSKESSISKELDNSSENKEELLAQIPRDLQRIYQSIFKSKNGQAVVKVEGGTCQGCHIKLTTMELQKARNEEGVVCCGNCQRILFVD